MHTLKPILLKTLVVGNGTAFFYVLKWFNQSRSAHVNQKFMEHLSNNPEFSSVSRWPELLIDAFDFYLPIILMALHVFVIYQILRKSNWIRPALLTCMFGLLVYTVQSKYGLTYNFDEFLFRLMQVYDPIPSIYDGIYWHTILYMGLLLLTVLGRFAALKWKTK